MCLVHFETMDYVWRRDMVRNGTSGRGAWELDDGGAGYFGECFVMAS